MKCKKCGKEKEEILLTDKDGKRKWKEVCFKCIESPQDFLIDIIKDIPSSWSLK